MKLHKLLLPAVCGLLFTAAIANAQVVVRIGPPRPIYERVPPPPRPGLAWHAGYHRWDGYRYVWVPGVYEAPPRPYARWVAGRWVRRGGGWVWIDGRWR